MFACFFSFTESKFRLLLISFHLSIQPNFSPSTGWWWWPQASSRTGIGVALRRCSRSSESNFFFSILGHHQGLTHTGLESFPLHLVALSHCTSRNTATTEWEGRDFSQPCCQDTNLKGKWSKCLRLFLFDFLAEYTQKCNNWNFSTSPWYGYCLLRTR